MNEILAPIFALLTALCWAQNSLVYAQLGRRVGADAVTHIRLWLALPLMFFVHFIFLGAFFPRGLTLEEILPILASGFLGFFVADIFLFRAFVYLGPREALAIMCVSPVFAIIFSFFLLGESLLPSKLLGIFIIILGLVLLIWGRGESSAKETMKGRGIFFAFLASISQVAGLILAKGGMIEGIHPLSVNLIRIGAGLVGLFIYSLLRGNVGKDFKCFTKNGILWLLFAVVVGPILGIILSLYALSMAPVGVVTSLMQLSPLMLLPYEIFYLKRKISIGSLGGSFLAVAGVFLLFL